MRRIKKRNLNTIRIKRDAYVGNVKDEEEVIVEETVDITPERVTMEEKTEPVCADVAADVENSVEEAETEAEAAEEKAEAEVAEETVAEEIGEADVAEEVEVAEETAPVEEVEVAEETAPAEEVESVEEPVEEEVESVEEPVEEEAESVEEPAAEEIAEETAEPAEEVVEDTVTVTPDEVVFDEEEKPVAESEEADVEESVLESEAGESAEEPAEEEVVEDTVTITPDEVVFDEEEKPVAESEETDVEEAVLEAEAEEAETAEAAEDTADAVEEVTEEVEEVPLEASEEESEEILDEEGSLDGTEEEVKELAQAEETEVGEVEETAEKVETEEVEEPEAEAVEETATAEEEKPAEKTEKEVFKLTTPANQDDILSRICVKRGRKLIYRPNEIIFNCTAAVTGTDKNNEEGIKVKSILDEEIKQGVKLGYIDKYDGLKMSEIKEEYENDVVYEYAEQEFKRVGLVLDGEKVKVYVYDWDMKALHHIGFVDQANVADLKPYLEDKEKYSFDVCGLITGGKFRKVIKDEATGKVTVEKGNDGKLGVELDISIINRKD